jgi:hypothetical protein
LELIAPAPSPERTAWQTAIDEALARGLVSVYREHPIGDTFSIDDNRRRLDILVSGPGFLIVIENKVWSEEHTTQTEAYWTWLAGFRGLRAAILLSPDGEAAASPHFRSLSYLELVKTLVRAATVPALEPMEETVLASYLKTIARRIVPVEMRAVRAVAAKENK